MKRLFIVLFSLIFLSGCSFAAPKQEISANDDEIVLFLNLDGIAEDIYRVDIEYYLDNDLMGGLATGNADETPYYGNPAFRLTPAEFPEGADLDNFSFHVVVSFDKGGTETFSTSERILSTNISENFNAEYGNVYRFCVSGSFADGLKLTADTPD